MKANHNARWHSGSTAAVVASTTKIQKWKQITTKSDEFGTVRMLLPVRQRYKNESKSQPRLTDTTVISVVASTTKIQKWKQITTIRDESIHPVLLLPVRQRYKNESKSQPRRGRTRACACCCQYDKDTKMKANHNKCCSNCFDPYVVASTTKIQKWKQITTSRYLFVLIVRCCQYDKDTKMKANHNLLE